jgi:hypothetical protein
VLVNTDSERSAGSEQADTDDRELHEAYERGDFARVRSRALSLLRDAAAPPELRGLAERYRARVSGDVVVYLVLGFALALFCAIVLRYARH